MAILIFEGADKSGKTSLREMIRRARNHEDVTLDRFFGSMIVYGKVFNKYTPEQMFDFEMKEKLFEANFKPVLIYCSTSMSVLKMRLLRHGHEEIPDKVLSDTLAEFNGYFKKTAYTLKIKIDTDEQTLEQSVNAIVKYLKDVGV